MKCRPPLVSDEARAGWESLPLIPDFLLNKRLLLKGEREIYVEKNRKFAKCCDYRAR